MIGTRSFMAKKETVERKWYLLDASEKPLGRLAVQAARILSGKHKPTYTPHVDTGDFVVIINADKVVLTGKKLTQSTIAKHSGHPGGLKVLSYKEVLERSPERLVERVIWGMLPKTKLGRDMYRKLKVYAGSAHPHAAQKPEKID
ncbi:MAG: 50S ribosomal protein L13 [Synergistes sp.]|nr:50S ribosomal protein L13 [Synergistes sp.]